MSQFTHFGGIDFSGAREPLSNLWSAIGEERDGELLITDVRPHAFRSDLAAFAIEGWKTETGATGSILWGADFPFGLPQDIAAHVGAGKDWDTQVRWVADRPADEVKEEAGDLLRSSRIADAGAMSPLDLRLYKQTVEGLRWIFEMREENDVAFHPQAPSDAATTTLIEVYPSATVRDLGLPRRRAPGRPGEIRARIASLLPYLQFADDRIAATVVTLEDAWDATIACLTAYHCRDDLDQPARLANGRLDQICMEGWIYRAPAALV